MRSSTKSGTVYVTDRNYCQVLALVANGAPFTALVHAPAIPVLATTDAFATVAPNGPTLAPGISVDLRDCSVNCPLLSDANGVTAASFVGVSLAAGSRSEEHTSELQSLMSTSYAVFCLK